MKTFPLGHILSVSGDKLVSPDGIGAVYDLLGYMTGEAPMTHQLPRFGRECRPHLIRQLPWLAEIDDSEVNGDNWRAWLDDKIERYGAEHEVAPIPTGAHVVRDPIREAEEMIGPDKVVTVSTVDTRHKLN